MESIDLVAALADLKEQDALKIVDERLNSGGDPFKILEDIHSAMEIVGKRFASNEYFIADLLYAAEILGVVTEKVKPKLAKTKEAKPLGKVIIGSVAGDIHDIGKNIVVFMLEANGFEVYDLGVDVSPEKFVNKILETGSHIVGLSGFLTLVFESMKNTVEAIEKAGLREKVKIMIGGGPINEEVRRHTGADAYGNDAVAAVALSKKWVAAT